MMNSFKDISPVIFVSLCGNSGESYAPTRSERGAAPHTPVSFWAGPFSRYNFSSARLDFFVGFFRQRTEEPGLLSYPLSQPAADRGTLLSSLMFLPLFLVLVLLLDRASGCFFSA
jgi:hypothetical protein